MEKALADFKTVLRLDPQEILGYYNRDRVWLRQKAWEQAEEDLKRALDLDPTYVKEWARWAVARSQRGDFRRALAAERAIALGHPEGYWLRALVLESAGRLEDVVEAYEVCAGKEKGHDLDARGRQ